MDTNPIGNEPGLQNDNVHVAEIQSCFSSTVITIPAFGINILEQKNLRKTLYMY